MKKKNIAILSVLALTVILMGATTVSAADKKMDRNRDNNRPVLTDEQKAEMEIRREEMKVEQEAMQKALESGDYNTWKSLIEARQAKQVNILETIDENNFAKFAEMNKLMGDKNFEGAKIIAEELGLNNAHGMGMGMGKMMNRGMGQGRGDCLNK